MANKGCGCKSKRGKACACKGHSLLGKSQTGQNMQGRGAIPPAAAPDESAQAIDRHLRFPSDGGTSWHSHAPCRFGCS